MARRPPKLIRFLKDAFKEVKEEITGERYIPENNYSPRPKVGVADVYKAAFNSDYKEVKDLLTKHPEYVNRYSSTGDTLLLFAVQRKDKTLVEILLDNGANPNAKSRQDDRTTYRADSRGFDTHPYSKSKGTPLFYAVTKNDGETVKLLLSKGADANIACENGATPLHMAARQGHVGLADMLLKKKAKIDAVDGLGNTPMFYAMTNKQSKLAKYLLKAGADKDFKNRYDNGFLHVAAENGDKEMIKHFISLGLDVNAQNKDGETALYITIPTMSMTQPAHFKTYHEIADMLLKAGAKTDLQTDKDGDNALNRASLFAHYPIVNMLISHKADIDITKDDATTALISAVSRCPLSNSSHKTSHINTIKLLLESGVNVNEQDSNGKTALYYACNNNKIDVIKLLLKHDADTNIVSLSKESPLSIAIERIDIETVQLLLKSGADIRYQKCDGETMVELAKKQYGSKDMAEILREWPKKERKNCKKTAQKRQGKKQDMQLQRRQNLRQFTNKRKPN